MQSCDEKRQGGNHHAHNEKKIEDQGRAPISLEIFPPDEETNQDLNMIIKVMCGFMKRWCSPVRLSTDEVKVTSYIRRWSYSETDVMLASASNAIIIGFNGAPTASSQYAR